MNTYNLRNQVQFGWVILLCGSRCWPGLQSLQSHPELAHLLSGSPKWQEAGGGPPWLLSRAFSILAVEFSAATHCEKGRENEAEATLYHNLIWEGLCHYSHGVLLATQTLPDTTQKKALHVKIRNWSSLGAILKARDHSCRGIFLALTLLLSHFHGFYFFFPSPSSSHLPSPQTSGPSPLILVFCTPVQGLTCPKQSKVNFLSQENC